MSPPGAVVYSARSGGSINTGGTSQRERLIRAAHAILDGCGYEMGPSRVLKIVCAFERKVASNGWSFFEYLANTVQLDADKRHQLLNDPDVMRVVSYADPTGETAVSNVLRGA